MFEEKLIIMNKTVQASPAGSVVSWSEGTEITAKTQISNMRDVQIAQAQGVKPNGYLVIDETLHRQLELNTYLKYPNGGFYLRVADTGIVEAGIGFFNERQYAIEVVNELPR